MNQKFTKCEFELQNFNECKNRVKIIILYVIFITLILISIYFVKTLSRKKDFILETLQSEMSTLEHSFTDEIRYSLYFLNVIVEQISDKYNNTKHILKILKSYDQSLKLDSPFGWQEYSFINKDYKEIVNSTTGIQKHPKKLRYLEQITKTSNFQNNYGTNIVTYICTNKDRNNKLKLIVNIFNKFSKKYVGYLILSFDIMYIVKKLETIKKYSYMNFYILDKNLEIFAQSENIDDVVAERVRKKVSLAVNKLNDSKEISYINMASGFNYCVKKINDLSLIFAVSFNELELKNSIITSIITKCIEILTISAAFLFVIIVLFLRKNHYKIKAEKAVMLANKATKTKSKFLAFTAHEIRSPLGFILAGSEIIKKELFGPIPEEYKNYITGIYQNSKMILSFLTDILDEEQTIEGRFKIVNSLENIETIINNAISLNKVRFHERKININFTSQENLPKLLCDPRRIFQVINNLISNAIKYSSDNTNIIIKCYLKNENLEIQFIDQGIGMTEEEISSILSSQKEFRTYKKHHDFVESYGLGLNIVKILLEGHDAKLLITSKKNIGTTVTIVFPKPKLIKV